MPTVYNLPVDDVLKRTVEYLQENVSTISPPRWAKYVKTGSHVEKPPQDPDWWYMRCASLLRKLYIKGPIGVARLKKEYGGRNKKCNVGKHRRSGGGKIIRTALLQLEEAGFVTKVEQGGRTLTNKGVSLLDSLSAEIQKKFENSIPELKKYR